MSINRKPIRQTYVQNVIGVIDSDDPYVEDSFIVPFEVNELVIGPVTFLRSENTKHENKMKEPQFVSLLSTILGNMTAIGNGLTHERFDNFDYNVQDPDLGPPNEVNFTGAHKTCAMADRSPDYYVFREPRTFRGTFLFGVSQYDLTKFNVRATAQVEFGVKLTFIQYE